MPTSVVIVTILGGALVGLVILLLLIEGASALRGMAVRGELRRRSLELLDEQIKAARALHVRNERARFAWNGYRKFVVERRVNEADGVCSFYLVPHDGKPLPDFKPGQFLTFQLNLPGHDKPVVRCYSLSDSASPDRWRVTIKRCLPPPDKPEIGPGVVSNYFHEHIHEEAILDVKSPSGNFVIDPDQKRPAVLLGGGIGITPLYSMASAVANKGSNREIWLFYGVRHRGEHALREQIAELTKSSPNIRVVTCYSHARAEDREGVDYDHGEHVSVELLNRYLDSNNYDFYLCGPPPMMVALTKQLKQWGVKDGDIHTEAFGPASVKAKKQSKPAKAPEAKAPAYRIRFAKCGKELPWDPMADSLLEFGEANGIPLEGGCRAGNCGTCEIAVINGEVEYTTSPEFSDLEVGCCLTCVSVPKGDLQLDA